MTEHLAELMAARQRRIEEAEAERLRRAEVERQREADRVAVVRELADSLVAAMEEHGEDLVMDALDEAARRRLAKSTPARPAKSAEAPSGSGLTQKRQLELRRALEAGGDRAGAFEAIPKSLLGLKDNRHVDFGGDPTKVKLLARLSADEWQAVLDAARAKGASAAKRR